MLKNIFSFPFLYTLILFVGYFDIYSYYSFFGIEISGFMTTSEILTSFFSRTLVIIPIISLWYLVALMFNRRIDNVTSKHPKKRLDRFYGFFLWRRIPLKSIFNAVNKLFVILAKLYFLLGFLLFPIFVGWYLFFTDLSNEVFLLNHRYTPMIYIYFVIYIGVFFSKDKYHVELLTGYAILVTSLSYIGLSNREKAKSIIYGKPTHLVSYSINSKKVRTGPSYIFFGMTENYLFFRNTSEGSNSIVKIEDIQDLSISKLTI